MPTSAKLKSIDHLLAEADELIAKINSDFFEALKEEHRLQFERHAQALQEIKSAFQARTGKNEHLEESSYAEGIHQAVMDIVKAMKDMVGYFA